MQTMSWSGRDFAGRVDREWGAAVAAPGGDWRRSRSAWAMADVMPAHGRRRSHAHCAFGLGPLGIVIGFVALAGAGGVVAFAALAALILLMASVVAVVGVTALGVVAIARVLQRDTPYGPHRRHWSTAFPPAQAESPIDVLRRRYAAGEIGPTEFRRRLVDLLKERYVRGDLTLEEYEARVRHVVLDPALQPPA